MSNKLSAVCVLHHNTDNILGVIRFTQNIKTGRVRISFNIYGLSDGKHGFHIHEYGNLTDGCASACAHFNPFNENHGGRKSIHRHVGDLGNIECKNGKCEGYFYDKLISLDRNSKCSIIGRSVIIHDKEDDLGKGTNESSLTTGNAGRRIACGVIGLAS